MLRIKMCGMTRREDVLEAVSLGVDAIGVVLYEKSPRYVTPEQAKPLVADLPSKVERVGVFVRAQAEEIAKAVQAAGLSAVQLYEGPSRRELEQAGCKVPIIRAVHADAGLAAQLALFAGEAILVDAPAQRQPGGTGATWDWSLLHQAPRPRYLLLAGGLHAGNVREAVTSARPDAVDVATGVESKPGVKDPERMAAFVAACSLFRMQREESW